MKKKDLRSVYELAVDENYETKTTIEQNRPNFIYFREDERQPTCKVDSKIRIPMNQTWSLPSRSYTWFPYYTMFLISK
jgi:hypothetical protein